MFINDAFLKSSREPSLVDDYDEDNQPVAQLPLLRTKGKEREATSNVHGVPASH